MIKKTLKLFNTGTCILWIYPLLLVGHGAGELSNIWIFVGTYAFLYVFTILSVCFWQYLIICVGDEYDKCITTKFRLFIYNGNGVKRSVIWKYILNGKIEK